MADQACNCFYGGPAMKNHTDRLKWNIKHILDFKNKNPHMTELKTKKIGLASFKEERTARNDLWDSIKNVPISYARLCPERAGRVLLWCNILLLIGVISTVVITINLVV